MGDFIIDTFCKNTISKIFENLIPSADMKLVGPSCPTRETATTGTCDDHVITSLRSIHPNVYVEMCDVSDH